MRRAISTGIVAAVIGSGLAMSGSASAAPADRPDTFTAAKSAKVSPNNRWLRSTLSSSKDRDWFHVRMHSAGRALVTLGHLPADYNLAVYNSNGHRVARSNRRGTHFEEIYRRFAAGDYYLRVAPVSTVVPTRSYALKFRPLSNTVLVAEQKNSGANGDFLIQGELLNNTPDWRDVLRIHVTWLDKNGHKVGSRNEGIRPGPIAPHRRAEFDISGSPSPAGDPPLAATSYRLRVDSALSKQRPPSGLVFTPGAKSATVKERVYTGTVTNKSSQTLHGIYPTVIEYDTYGRANVVSYDLIKTLRPGQTRNYTIYVTIKNNPVPNAVRQFATITEGFTTTG